jgi:hypothetical protein
MCLSVCACCCAGEGILFVHDEQELALYDWPMVSSSDSSSGGGSSSSSSHQQWQLQ